jgi:hypothetical protein
MANEIGIINCYDNLNPITARINLSEPDLNSVLTQVNTYNSSVNNFNNWIQLKATLPPSTDTVNFDINLQIDTGLNCCCQYEIYVDKISIICSGNTESPIVNDIKCPGYGITKVIDNKKSWVYNPGIAEIGISEYDNIERADGSFGLISGEGTINRIFTPSPDAEIPWRYTNYFLQSSVYEKHSNLTLNSKELWLIFNMCADCPISGTSLTCPTGYTLSANTNFCYSGVSVTTATTVVTVSYLSLLELENYKKQFQSFWTPFLEQFIPATTIWVAGERWCNDPCTVIDTCAFDLTESELSFVTIQETTNTSNNTNIVTSYASPEVFSSTATSAPSGGYSGQLPTNSNANTITILDLGNTSSTPNTVTEEDSNIDMLSYQSRFTTPNTITQF